MRESDLPGRWPTAMLQGREGYVMFGDLEARGVKDPATLRSMQTVPRDRFVPDDLRDKSRGQSNSGIAVRRIWRDGITQILEMGDDLDISSNHWIQGGKNLQPLEIYVLFTFRANSNCFSVSRDS